MMKKREKKVEKNSDGKEKKEVMAGKWVKWEWREKRTKEKDSNCLRRKYTK